MVVAAREAHVGRLVHVERRHDVDHGEALDALRMVEREPVRDAAAAVVADDGEALVAERAHQRDQVGGHRALAVLRVIELGRRRGRRLGRIAVAAQVGNDEARSRRPARARPGATSRASADSRAAAAAAASIDRRRCARTARPSPTGCRPLSNPSNQAMAAPSRGAAGFSPRRARVAAQAASATASRCGAAHAAARLADAQALDDVLDGVAQPALRRIALVAAVPEHADLDPRQVERDRADDETVGEAARRDEAARQHRAAGPSRGRRAPRSRTGSPSGRRAGCGRAPRAPRRRSRAAGRRS